MCLHVCERYEINAWEIAICFICTVLAACIAQKDCEKHRPELRKSLSVIGFEIVCTIHDMFA